MFVVVAVVSFEVLDHHDVFEKCPCQKFGRASNGKRLPGGGQYLLFLVRP